MLHLSIDDFFMTFEALTEQQEQYTSLFEHPVLFFFREMHEKYGAVFHCYCFGEDVESGFSLKDVTRKYREEFRANASWLKFGFHGWNKDAVYGDNRGTRIINRDAKQAAEDYDYICGNLTEIVGEEALDDFPRIHFFAGTRECCMAWNDTQYGISGLLAADDDRYSYYHDTEQHDALIAEGIWQDEELQLLFRRTHIRLENEPDMEVLKRKIKEFKENMLVVFTHEYFLQEPEMQQKIELCLQTANNKF